MTFSFLLLLIQPLKKTIHFKTGRADVFLLRIVHPHALLDGFILASKSRYLNDDYSDLVFRNIPTLSYEPPIRRDINFITAPKSQLKRSLCLDSAILDVSEYRRKQLDAVAIKLNGLYNKNMRKLVVLTFLSLDGIMQAPGGKGEDPSGGFQLEGWTVPYFDEALGEEMTKQMGQPFDLLLGRKTYDVFASYWPQQGEADPINQARKYVVSHEDINTDWKETIPVRGDVTVEIEKLKQQEGPMLQVHGSSALIQTLFARDLVDELWLKIFPVILGKGKRLFGEGTRPAAFKLTESTVSPSGVIVASYKRDGEVRLGSF